MRILSYNICGNRARRNPRHIEAIAAVIREAQPDVAGLQEVYQGEGSAFGDQPRQLEELTGMKCVFWPHLDLHGTCYGNAVLTRGEVGPAAMYRLPNRLLQLRALLEVRTEINGLELDFFSTHLVHFGFVMTRARSQQLAAIARRLSDRSHPRILVGDLNTGWKNLDMAGLAKAGLHPVCHEELRTYSARRPRFCFDHIFASPDWECRSVRTLATQASDHLPLLAEMVVVPRRMEGTATGSRGVGEGILV